MDREILCRFRDATPFVPFDSRLADGRVLRVPRADYISVSPCGPSAVVFLASGGHVTFQLDYAVDVSPHRDVLHMLFDTADA